MENKNEEVTERHKWAREIINQTERQAKRWFIAFLVTLAALVATNALWIYVFNTYEYIYQDGSGENYYNNEIDGDVDNGTVY